MLAKIALVVLLLSGALHVIIAVALIARLPGAARLRDLERWSQGLSQPRNMRLFIVALINIPVMFGAFAAFALLGNPSDAPRIERSFLDSQTTKTNP